MKNTWFSSYSTGLHELHCDDADDDDRNAHPTAIVNTCKMVYCVVDERERMLLTNVRVAQTYRLTNCEWIKWQRIWGQWGIAWVSEKADCKSRRHDI
jgi:hypothetical protein